MGIDNLLAEEAEAAELVEWDVPGWDSSTLLYAAEVGAAWAFLVLLEEGRPDRTALTEGIKEALGYSPEDLPDFKRWSRFLDEADHRRLEKFFTILPSSRRPFEIEFKVRSKSGVVLWMKVFARRLEDRVVGVFRDITLERMAEDGLNRQYQLISAVFSSAPVPILLCDENFRVIECNPSGADFLGAASTAQAFGLDLLPVFALSAQETLRKALTSEGQDTRFLSLERSGTLRRQPGTIEISFTKVIHDDEKKYFLLMVGTEVPAPVLEDQLIQVYAVEDNPQSRLLLEKATEKLGISIQCHASAEGFLEKWDNQGNSLVLIDLGLAGMNGIDLAKELRRLQETAGVKYLWLYLMTAYNKKVVEGMDTKTYFDGYLEKPVDLTTLRKILSKLHVVRS